MNTKINKEHIVKITSYPEKEDTRLWTYVPEKRNGIFSKRTIPHFLQNTYWDRESIPLEGRTENLEINESSYFDINKKIVYSYPKLVITLSDGSSEILYFPEMLSLTNWISNNLKGLDLLKI